jgi:hypothetical protein
MCKDIPPVAVDAGHADHGASEASSGLVGHVGGLNIRSDVVEGRLVRRPPAELQCPVLHLGLEDDPV